MKRSILVLVLVFIISLSLTVGAFAEGETPESTPEPVFDAKSAAAEVGSTTENPDPENIVDENNNGNYGDDCDKSSSCDYGTGDSNTQTYVSGEKIEVAIIKTGSKNGQNHFIDFSSDDPTDCDASAFYCGTEEYDEGTGLYTYTVYQNEGAEGDPQDISHSTFWNTEDDPDPTQTPGVTETPEVTQTPEGTKTPEVTQTPGETKTPEVTETPGKTKTPGATATPVEGPEDEPETGIFDIGILQLVGLAGMGLSGVGIYFVAKKEQ